MELQAPYFYVKSDVKLSLNTYARTSLAVWWLRLHPSNAGGTIPGQGTRNPHAWGEAKK